MASIEDVVAGVRAVLDQFAAVRRTLVGVLTGLESAGTTYATLGEGSTQPDLGNSAAYLEHAYDVCRQVIALLDQAGDRATAYLVVIAGPAPAEPRPVTPEPWRLTRDQVEALRRQLPDAITAEQRGTGRKTHGRWVGSDGRTRAVASGIDAQSLVTRAHLRSLGYVKLAVEDHAEMKLAAYLRTMFEKTGQPQHATIVVNNQVCWGGPSCSELLPVMLPVGCSLTVHAPNYRRTFTGGA